MSTANFQPRMQPVQINGVRHHLHLDTKPNSSYGHLTPDLRGNAALAFMRFILSSGQMRDQSSGRSRSRVIRPPVAISICAQYPASINEPRSRQFETTDIATPRNLASLATPPTISTASSSASCRSSTGNIFMQSQYHYSNYIVNAKEIHLSGLIPPMKTNVLGARLRAARKAKNLTQAQLAAKANITQGTVGNIDSGARGYGESLVDIARVLSVTPAFLQGRRETVLETKVQQLELLQSRPSEIETQIKVVENEFIELLVMYQTASQKGRQFILKSARAADKDADIAWRRVANQG